MTTLSWNPVRQGETYCSPACGRGCTLTEFTEAHLRGNALREQLGQRWVVRVRENLGWHASVESHDGRVKVHPTTGTPGYMAFLGQNGPGGEFVADGDSPLQAVAGVVAKARREAKRLAALVDGL
jgi:hypothetical protein